MEELGKIYRVIDKELPYSDREKFLVLDATTGQNAVSQAKEFMKIAEVSGIVLTKLDGTARGGVVLSIKNDLKLPVKFIGVGEGIDDLQPFSATAFAESLYDVMPENEDEEDPIITVNEERLARDKAEAAERAKKAAEEEAKRKAEEEKAKAEAEEKAKAEAEEKVKAEAEEKVKAEAEEKVKAEAEEKAKVEAEEKVKAETEEKAKVEAEEKVKAETEEKTKAEADSEETPALEEKAEEKKKPAKKSGGFKNWSSSKEYY